MKNAFALSEMLVVIAVTGVIAAILLLQIPPIIGRADRTADFAALNHIEQSINTVQNDSEYWGQ